jgi:hypothetical protein
MILPGKKLFVYFSTSLQDTIFPLSTQKLLEKYNLNDDEKIKLESLRNKERLKKKNSKSNPPARCIFYILSTWLIFVGKKVMTKKEKRELMFDMVERWQASGLSQTRFALQEGCHLAKFQYWIKKYHAPIDQSNDFIQIGGLPGANIHLRLPNGVELLLPVQTPVAYIKSLVQIF